MHATVHDSWNDSSSLLTCLVIGRGVLGTAESAPASAGEGGMGGWHGRTRGWRRRLEINVLSGDGSTEEHAAAWRCGPCGGCPGP